MAQTVEQDWNSLGLERCHIIARSEGGNCSPGNVVLLCARCHGEAPMVASPQPMLDWVNRRESHIHWVARRLLEECLAARPTMATDIASLQLSREEFLTVFRAVKTLLRPGYHPGGEMFATVAAVMSGIADLGEVVQVLRK